jgi:hypothetical protein
MNESQWDEKLRSFLKKTGDDLKRAGQDIKVEAERLMHDLNDENRQEKVKAGLANIKVWARKTVEEVASVVETGMKKAEGAVRSTAEKVQGAVDTTPPAHEEQAEAPRRDTPVDTPVVEEPAEPSAPPAPAKKTIGGKKKKASAKAKPASKKPLGKKRTP